MLNAPRQNKDGLIAPRPKKNGPKAQDKTRQNTGGPKPKTQRRKTQKIKQKWATRKGQPLKKNYY